MKKIKLNGKAVVFDKKCAACGQALGAPRTLTQEQMIRACLDHPPQQGMVASVQRQRFIILDQLEKMKCKVLLLEAKDLEQLQLCVQNMPWNTLDRDILGFSDMFDDPEDVDVEEKQKKKG